MRKTIFLLSFSFIALVAIFFYQQVRFHDGKLHIVFCDVGQGDGIFMRTPNGTDIIIDGGPDDSMLSCLSDNMPFWDRKIELMVLTHPHEDHLNGLISITERYQVSAFVSSKTRRTSASYKALATALADDNATQRFSCQGDTIKIADGVVLKTLWPKVCGDEQDTDNNSDLNDISIVQLLSYKDFQILLTGDAGAEIQNQVSLLSGAVEVLKIPHHGSRTGLDEATLATIQPKLAVIPVGKRNRYGHPAKNILSLLEEKEIKIKRTDQIGDIKIVTDGKVFSMTK